MDTAYDAESAMEKIQAGKADGAPPFDLVITDVLMPGMSGIELLKWLHDNHSEIAVLVISGMDLPLGSEKELLPICYSFERKPLTPGLMLDAIQRIETQINSNRFVAV